MGIIYEQPSVRTFMFNGGGLDLNPSGLVGNGKLTTFLQESSDTSVINWDQSRAGFPQCRNRWKRMQFVQCIGFCKSMQRIRSGSAP